jgi:polyisoprenoid-binding protein YceI
MRKSIVAFVAALGLLPALPALAAEWPLVATSSSIAFTFKQMNVPVDGRFKKFSGKIDFDPARPETSSIDMQVDIASISASEDADPEAVKPAWLDAVAHPQARFVSKSVKALGGGHYQAAGLLSIKGVSRDITVPFDFKEQGAGASVDGQFTLRRGDYKVGEGDWSAFDVVANDVLVKFHLVVGAAGAKP